MAAPTQRTLDRLDLVKTVAVVINSHHKTDRTGGVLDAVTVRVTDARHLRDGGDFFASRLLPGYRLEESTGARNPPDPGQRALPKGTGIKGGTEPNTFTFSVSNREDPAGQTLDSWKNYALVGAEIIVSRGAERDGTGAAHVFDDYVEVFYGRIRAAQRSDKEWRIEATSPEGWNADRNLVRRSFLGLGYGISMDNLLLPADEAYMSGTGNTFVPTSGKYAWSAILTFLALPEDVPGVDRFTIFRYGTNRIVVTVAEAGNSVTVRHHNGVSQTEFTFPAFELTNDLVERPIKFGCRHDGSFLYLYVEGILVDSVATTRNPAADGTSIQIGRRVGDTWLGSFILYELWISDDDPGDVAMRARQAGPLEYDRAAQPDLWALWKMLEGGISPAETETADLVFDGAELDLTIGGPAAWTDSEEGDKPSVGSRPRGDSKPFVLGRVFNFPPAFRSRAGVADPDPVHEVAPWLLRMDAARVDGSPLSVAFTETDTLRLRTNLGPDNRSAIESPDLARVVIGPVVDAGTQLSPGSDLEISGGHIEDGVKFVTGVEGERFVFVEDGDGNGFSAEDLSAAVTITVPQIGLAADVTNGSDGTLTTAKLRTGQVAVDVEREAGTTPTAPAAMIFLRNAKSRAESVPIEDSSFSDNHDVTWVGDVGARDLPWSLGIRGGEDLSFEEANRQLLQSFGAWSTDMARVDIEPGPGVTLAEGIRAGHYRAPDLSAVAADHAFSAQQVDDETIEELATLPPAWRLVMRHRPNYAPVEERQIPGAVAPSERKALSSGFRSYEVFRDQSIRDDFENAREVFWETNLWGVDAAARVGILLADFLSVPRTWWKFRLQVRPEVLLIGEDFSVTHERIAVDVAGDADPLAMIALGKGHGITVRGIDVVAVA